MLTITITNGVKEDYDEVNNKFIYHDEVVLGVIDLEHSLASMSKWESIHKIPFLSTPDLSPEQIYDYLKCMIVTPGVDPDILAHCSQENFNAIQAYINTSETATTFGKVPEQGASRERITTELIHYWMLTYQIPVEAEHWHLSRLLALIKICSIKNSKPTKRSVAEINAERARINAERKQQYQTTG